MIEKVSILNRDYPRFDLTFISNQMIRVTEMPVNEYNILD